MDKTWLVTRHMPMYTLNHIILANVAVVKIANTIKHTKRYYAIFPEV